MRLDQRRGRQDTFFNQARCVSRQIVFEDGSKKLCDAKYQFVDTTCILNINENFMLDDFNDTQNKNRH